MGHGGRRLDLGRARRRSRTKAPRIRGRAARAEAIAAAGATAAATAIGPRLSPGPRAGLPRSRPEHDAIKPDRIVLSSHRFWSMILSEKSATFRDHALSSQHAAGAPANFGNDLRRDGVDLLICHGLVARCERHGDCDRFLIRIDAWPLVNVEHRDACDQLAVHTLCGAHDVAGAHRAVDDEGEVALERLEWRELERALGTRRFRLRL